MPNDDNVKYSTMADKLEWDKVQVGQHTPSDCKDQWTCITTKVDLKGTSTLKNIPRKTNIYVK